MAAVMEEPVLVEASDYIEPKIEPGPKEPKEVKVEKAPEKRIEEKKEERKGFEDKRRDLLVWGAGVLAEHTKFKSKFSKLVQEMENGIEIEGIISVDLVWKNLTSAERECLKLAPGSLVSARWRTGMWYNAVVTEVKVNNGKPVYTVHYDDNGCSVNSGCEIAPREPMSELYWKNIRDAIFPKRDIIINLYNVCLLKLLAGDRVWQCVDFTWPSGLKGTIWRLKKLLWVSIDMDCNIFASCQQEEVIKFNFVPKAQPQSYCVLLDQSCQLLSAVEQLHLYAGAFCFKMSGAVIVDK
jgi:hypothetical protein